MNATTLTSVNTPDPRAVPATSGTPAAHVVLLPTEGCNLRCVYCFQPHTPVTMSRSTRGAVRRLLRRLVEEEQAPALHVEWYGGEPLAAWNVVEELSSFARDLARRHAIPFTMSMTTNGTLLGPSRFARLTELGCTDYQITLDGPAETHDRRRISAGGGGSFQRIWKNLMAMRESDASFRVVLRLGFDRHNVDRLRSWIPELARVFAGDPRFELYARPIAYPDGSGPGFAADEAREIKVMIDRELATAGLTVVDMRRENRPGGIACHAGSAASIMVGPDGTLHKCAVGLESPNNRIGRLRADGTLELDLPLWQAWTTAATPCTVLGSGAGARPAQASSSCPAEPRTACPANPGLTCPAEPRSACPAEPRSDTCPASPADISFACPASPQAPCPALPCPASPELACPAEPRSTCPAEPHSDTCPASPADISFACPASPQTPCPALPCPANPGLTCPAEPRSACPAEPRSDTCPASPADISFACPASPQAACPALPCPASPELACPAEPRSACPAEPWSACPASPDMSALARPSGPGV